MSGILLLDTGPLVALLERRDRYHPWAREQLASQRQPLATCEPVLTEACHLVRRLSSGPAAVMDLLRQEVITIAFDLAAEQDRVAALLRQYADAPMSLADACLVRMSELVGECAVFTIDGDFRVYRRHGRQKIPLLIPPQV